MTQVTLTFLEPRVELVFDDEEVSLISSVDADTVNGVTPGTVGLLVLATNTQAEAQAAIGVSSSTTTEAAIAQRVGAHEKALDPHPVYARKDQVEVIAHGIASRELTRIAKAVNPFPQYPLADQAILSSNAAREVSRIAKAVNPFPQYSLADQAILSANFFGG